MIVRYATACLFLILTTGISQAQTSDHQNSWFTQNYRFTGPPHRGETKPVDPVLLELQDIQNTLMAILRKANFDGDYEAALAAASQATANAQLIGVINQQLQAAQTRKTALEGAQTESPVYLIALKDQSIQAATSYWSDGRMLHYMTVQGAHEQVRPDLVDWRLSSALNGRGKPEYRMPEPKIRLAAAK